MPSPRKGEKKQPFINRCVEHLITKEDRKPDQARAMCESLWEDKDKKKGESVNKIPLIMDSVINIPWAILPSKLDEIMAVLQSKNEGILLEMVEQNKQVEPQDRNYSVEDGIAEITINGILSKRMNIIQALSGGTSYQGIQNQINKAESDPNVKGLFYDIDSPGGNVDGLFNATDAIFNTKKPSLSFANGLMASAAYIMGSGTDYVVAADRSVEIGSLGVIAVLFDESKKYEAAGIKPTVFAAGKYKKIGNKYEPLSDQDKKYIQGKLDYMYSLAVDTISRHRNMSVKEMIDHEVVGGDVFIGEQAINIGLVDEILNKEQAIARLKEMI